MPLTLADLALRTEDPIVLEGDERLEFIEGVCNSEGITPEGEAELRSATRILGYKGQYGRNHHPPVSACPFNVPGGKRLFSYFGGRWWFTEQTTIPFSHEADPTELTFEQTKALLDDLTNEQRAELFSSYCLMCGKGDPTCECSNTGR